MRKPGTGTDSRAVGRRWRQRARQWCSGVALLALAASGLILPVAAPAAADTPSTSSGYVAIRPCRVVDTRLAGGAIGPRGERAFTVTGTSGFAGQGGRSTGCRIPVGATAVEATVTAISPTSTGFLRAWPNGGAAPIGTFLSFHAGTSVTNSGAIPLAVAGPQQLQVFNSAGRTHYVIDVQGYFVASGGQQYRPITPCRIVDTRSGGPLGPDAQRAFTVTGTAGFSGQGGTSGGCGIPAGVTAVEASVTAVGPTATGSFRVWPNGGAMPRATFLTFESGTDVTNTGTLSLASTGAQQLEVLNSRGSTHYVIDVHGYYSTGGGGVYVPVTRCRIVDTRVAGGPVAAGSQRGFTVSGSTGFEAQGGSTDGCGIPSGALAVESAVTAVRPPAAGRARLWPAGVSMPEATFLSYSAGRSITNTGALALATSRPKQLRLYNSGGPTDFVIDVEGYFVAASSPAAPGAPTAVGGDGRVDLMWSAPSSDGGSAVTGYVITPRSGGTDLAPITTAGPATTATIPDLANGTSYTFTVAAQNALGVGAPSLPSSPVTPATVPGAPTNVTASAADRRAVVSWDAPASTGGADIVGYLVTTRSGGTEVMSAFVPSTATSRQVEGLSNGTAYSFEVAAVNAAGTGARSDPSSVVTPVTSATVPGPPVSVTASGGDGQAAVSWAAPSSDGGAAITGYTITPYIGAAAQASISSPGTGTSTTLVGLTNGAAYTFKVAAQNAIGTGAPSDPSNAVTPAAVPTVPGAPAGVAASGGDSSATVTWVRPVSDGGTPIDSYLVVPYVGNVAKPSIPVAATSTTVTVPGLVNGTTYTFVVFAGNALGYSTKSAPSNPVTPATTVFVPGPPTAVTAVAGNASATVNWTAPQSNGGAAITGYWVIASPANSEQIWRFNAGSATTMAFSGLTNGTAYTFTVRAANAVGYGSASTPSSPVTTSAPNVVPSAPLNPTAAPGDGQATLSWTAPTSTGGASITSYVITPYIGTEEQAPVVSAGAATTKTLTGLINGTTYSFRVAAVNTAGTGPQSVATTATTPMAPVLRVGATVVSVTTPDPSNATLRGSQDTGVTATVGGVAVPYLMCFGSTCTTLGATGTPLTGSCTTATPLSSTVIRIANVAGAPYCADHYTVKAGGLQTTFQANRYDPLSLEINDGLVIRYADDFTLRWNDRGTHTDGNNAGMFDPVLPLGYYSLGSAISTEQDDLDHKQVVLIARDSLGHGTLAQPSGWVRLWSNNDGGGDEEGSLWLPTCPAGYVAMGGFASHGRIGDFFFPPSTSSARCVREDLTMPGRVGSQFTNDDGSGNDAGGYHFFNTDGPAAPPSDRSVLLTGLPVSQTYGFEASESVARVLLVASFPVLNDIETPRRPALTSCDALRSSELVSPPLAERSIRVPYTLLGDQLAGDIRHAADSPFYTVRKLRHYGGAAGASIDNCGGSVGSTVGLTYTTGSSQTVSSRFTESTGLKITVGATVTGGPVSVTASVEVTRNLEWSTETVNSITHEESFTQNVCAPGGHSVQLISQFEGFDVMNLQGIVVDHQDVGIGATKVLDYRQPGASDSRC